jgi:hypothetical protein
MNRFFVIGDMLEENQYLHPSMAELCRVLLHLHHRWMLSIVFATVTVLPNPMPLRLSVPDRVILLFHRPAIQLPEF